MEVQEFELRGKADQLIATMNTLEGATKGFATQLQAVLQHLDDINKKSLGNIGKQINNTVQNRNIEQQNVARNYDFGSAPRVAMNSRGSVMTSASERDKLFRDYEQAIIAETQAIRNDIEMRSRMRVSREKTERMNANSRAVTAGKMEDRSTEAYIADRRMNAQARLLAAKNKRHLLSDWSYQIGGGIQRAGSLLRQFGTGGQIAAGVTDILGSALKSPAAGAAAAIYEMANAATSFTKAAMSAYVEIESVKTSLSVVFSSQTQSDAMFGQIADYAVKSPFGVQQTSELAVLLKQSGVYASDLMDTLKMLGDTAGGNMEKMKRIANNYAQIVSIGKASMLDMRQFAYAGIPIFEAVSKELKVSQSELRKLISDGKVTSEIVEKAFKDLTGVNGVFENATEKGAKTLKARLQNLSDAKQLAMAGVGESMFNFGANTGNDSVLNNLLKTAENIFTWLQEYVKDENTEKEIDVIEENASRIAALQDAIVNAKTNPSYDNIERMSMVRALEDELQKELKKFGSDDIRAAYTSSYDNKNKQWQEFAEQYKTSSMELAFQFASAEKAFLEGKIKEQKNRSFGSAITDVLDSQLYEERSPGEAVKALFNARNSNVELAAAEARLDKINDFLKTYGKSRTTTDTERQKKSESRILAGQSLAADTINSNADKSSSLNARFDELTSIVRDSEKKRQEEEDKHLKDLKEALEILKELNTHVKDGDIIDMTSFSSLDEFMKYYDQGAFRSERNLNVNNDSKDYAQKVADRKVLTDNLSFVLGGIKETLQGYERYAGFSNIQAQIDEGWEKITRISSHNIDSFYQKLNPFLTGIEDEIRSQETEGRISKKDADELIRRIATGTISYSLNNKGLDATFEEKEKKKELDKYIPLWKRIAAGATGWDASLVGDSGAGFIGKYSNQAARNVVTGGAQGLVSAGAMAGDILTRMRYGDEQNKQGVRQIDWKKTESDMIRDAFSMKDGVKASAAALSGLSKALGDQLSVYEKLTVDMIGVGEDWGTIQNSMLGKFANDPHLKEGDFLDSAFQAAAKSVGGYSLGYDSELGMVVKDGSGKIAGSVDELKASEGRLDGDLKSFVQSIKKDSVIEALDNLRKSTMALNGTVSLANSIAKQSYEWEKQGNKTWAKSLGGSVGTLGILGRALSDTEGGDSLAGSTGSLSKKTRKKAGQYLSGFLSMMAGSISDIDVSRWDSKSMQAVSDRLGGDKIAGRKAESVKRAVESFQNAGDDLQSQIEALAEVFKAFGVSFDNLIESAKNLALKDEKSEYNDMASDWLRNDYGGGFWGTGKNKAYVQDGNSLSQQNAMSNLGLSGSFAKFSEGITKNAMSNPTEYSELVAAYKKKAIKAAKETLEKNGASDEDISNATGLIEEAFDSGDIKAAQDRTDFFAGESAFDSATESANKYAMSIENIASKLHDLGANLGNVMEQFAGQAVSSTFETWGKSLAEGADSSKSLMENFRQLGAGLMQNLGVMITEAGLSMAIHASSAPEVWAGLAIAAAGAGASFLGGYLSADKDDDDEEEDKYKKLQQVKDDLSDLLKQAREDAIYYENTLRHKKAISANEGLTATKVNDAIITPSGNVISTHPDDYLIATKTPQTLIGGGSPTINFSVIDKSTGIKVTQQKSTYNKEDNSIDFEAVIESKVQEIIATSKGDDAFAARQARLDGRRVIA